jgi:hypothetical protein
VADLNAARAVRRRATDRKFDTIARKSPVSGKKSENGAGYCWLPGASLK